MVKRILNTFGFVLYTIIVLAPTFFPYMLVRGWKKTENELLKPMFYFMDGM
jgi:glycopeptide antibiotics resistance protein